jgi:hypothetical protein
MVRERAGGMRNCDSSGYGENGYLAGKIYKKNAW